MDNVQISTDILSSIFDELREGQRRELSKTDYTRNRDYFIFHIIECLDDLQGLQELLSGAMDPAIASSRMVGILYHVVPHFNAATRLLLDRVPDTFAKQDTTDFH